MAMMMAGMDPVEKKLDMSLEEIAEERKGEQNQQPQQPQQALAQAPAPSSPTASGKIKNSKRADRLAQSGPYQSRTSRHGNADASGSHGASASNRVYVGNLSWGVNSSMLSAHMQAAGEVEHASVMEANGRSKGCGLVTFFSEADAQRAIATLNDTELDGRKIFVREDREQMPTAGGAGGRTHKGCRVYVGNLSWTVKWQDLKDHMKQAGTVVHADVLEEATGRSKGCGLVEFETAQQAQAAIAMLNDTELEGRKIFVREDREPDGGSISSIAKRAGGGGRGMGGRGFGGGGGGFGAPPMMMSAPPVPPRMYYPVEGTAVYVGNLPWDVTWQSLKDLFRTVGEVERAEVAQMPDGRSRGFGIVRFLNPMAAQMAIERLNGAELNGRVIEVRYDKSR